MKRNETCDTSNDISTRISTRLQAYAKTRQKKFQKSIFPALSFLHIFKSKCLISYAYLMLLCEPGFRDYGKIIICMQIMWTGSRVFPTEHNIHCCVVIAQCKSFWLSIPATGHPSATGKFNEKKISYVYKFEN